VRQQAPIVYARFIRNTPETARFVDMALARALYVSKTTRQVQKLRVGFGLPDPDLSTPEFIDLDLLNDEINDAFRDKLEPADDEPE
jgi:hypothetical protein